MTKIQPPAAARPRHRLAKRLVQLIVVASSLIAIAITAAQLYLEFARDVGDIRARFEQIEDAYLPSVIQNVWLTDRARLQVLLDGIRRLPDFESAQVLVDGKPFVISGKSAAAPEMVRQFPLIQEFRGRPVDIGVLEVTASLDGPLQRTWQRLWFVLLLNGLKTAVIAGLIFLLVRRMITGPVQRMAQQARRLANDDLDQPLTLRLTYPSRADDEIHGLAADLERMRLSLRQQRDALLKSNEDLSLALADKEIALLQSKASEQAFQESRAHLARAQQVANLGSWEWTWGEEEMRWSEEVFRLLGVTPVAGKLAVASRSSLSRLRAAVHVDDRPLLERQLQEARESRQASAAEFRVVAGDGSVRLLRQLVELLSDGAAGAIRLLGTLQDITEQKRVEEALELAASVFTTTREGILVTDARGVILTVNPAFTAITGFTPREAEGKTPRILKSGRHGHEFYARMWSELLHSGRWQGEIWNRRKNGETYIEWLSITRIEGGDEHGGFVSTFTDITKRKEAEELMEHKAHHDALTDLPNRSLFRDRLHAALSVARRYERQLGLLYIDLDLFKHVNDTLGHAAGDALLIEAAHRLTAAVRESDTVARLGGDEFAVVLAELNGALEAEEVAQRIVEAMRRPFELNEGTGRITASIGVALFPEHGSDAEALQKHADLALYAVKESGRNAYRVYSPLLSK